MASKGKAMIGGLCPPEAEALWFSALNFDALLRVILQTYFWLQSFGLYSLY